MARIDTETAARAAELANRLGSDEEAGKVLGLSARTVRRYRKLASESPEVARAAKEKAELIHRELDDEMVDTLRAIVGKIRELVADAPLEALRDVNGSAKIIGDLLTTRTGMGIDERSKPAKQRDDDGGQPGPDGQGQAAAEAQGGNVLPIRGVRRTAAE